MSAARARLGRALKSIRSQMGMSLAAMADRTGVSVSTLSKVENGQMSLTYDKLVQLSEGLEVDITAFFEPGPTVVGGSTAPAVTARRSITPADGGTLVETANYSYRYLGSDLSQKAMIPILITVRAHSLVDFSALSRHSGEEFIYVLSGQVIVHTEHYEPVSLMPGESLYIDSTMGHAFLAGGDKEALMLNVCHSPGSNSFKTLVEMARARDKEDKKPA